MFKWLSRHARMFYLHFLFLFLLFDLFVYVAVVPTIAEVFKGFGAELPLNHRVVIFVGENLKWLNHPWALFVVPPSLYAISIYLYKKGWFNKKTEILLFIILAFVFIFTFVTLFTPIFG